jgi:membrane protein DedA with SNARE-associated domain
MNEIEQFFSNVLAAVNQGDAVALLAMVGITAITELGIPTFGLIDAVLIYAGYEFGLLSFRALLIILLLTLGRLLGSSAIFWPSRIYGASFINWLGRRFPSLSFAMQKVSSRLGRRQALAVVIVRFTPGLLIAGSVASGMLRTKYRNFMIGVAIHAVIADIVLILIGQLGRYGISVAGINPQPWQVVAAAIVLVLGGTLAVFFFQRRSARKSAQKCDSANDTNK